MSITNMLERILHTSKNFFVYRHLLAHLIVREIKSRFAGSSAGILWSFIHPLIMILVYLFVFVYIFKLRLPEYSGGKEAAMFLMAGLFPWMALAEGLIRSASSLIENATLIQKTIFPTEVLPAKAVVSAFATHGVAIGALAIYAVIIKHHFAILLYLPFIIILQIFFTLGLGFMLSCLTIFLRDTLHVLQLLVGFWIYLTPILYPVSMLPEWARLAMYGNPVYPLISIYQSLFLNGDIGNFLMFLLVLMWTIFFYFLGAFFFSKLKYEFADWL